MPQTINTNVASLNAQRNLNASQSDANTALQRLSSGLRINGAAELWLCSFVAGVSKVPNKLIWRFGSANLIANRRFAQ